MRRIISVLAMVAVLAAIMAVMAAPAFAQGRADATPACGKMLDTYPLNKPPAWAFSNAGCPPPPG
jgi:hypothetical protein